MKSVILAKDMLVTSLLTLPPDAPVYKGIGFLLKHNITGAPVMGPARQYLGVFSEKCCMSVLTQTARLAAEGPARTASHRLAREFMVTKLLTMSPHMDVLDAIGNLLKHRVSGAPVVDEEQNFLGVFSEKTTMSVLVECAYESSPGAEVAAFMNTDFKRTIAEENDLLTMAQIFLDTPYRRLPVLREGKLVGQISRRDVLRAENIVCRTVQDREARLVEGSGAIERSEAAAEPPHERVVVAEVAAFMDTQARTVTEDTDFLSIVQIFLNTPYRRLPVLRDGQLVGQISRRDVLQKTYNLLEVVPEHKRSLLYLSSLFEPPELPSGLST